MRWFFARFVLIGLIAFGSVSFSQKNTVSNFLHESKHYGKIIGLGAASTIAYGIVHDQVTARICPEYFTKGFHERMMNNWQGVPLLDTCRELLIKHKDSPTIVAGIWGVVATWWVGIPLGVALALSARAGSLPKLKAKDLWGKILKSLMITGASSFVAGLIGYGLVKNDLVQLNASGVQGVPENKMAVFGADAFAHWAAYNVGALTALGLCLAILKERYDLSWEQAMKEQEERLTELLSS